MSSTQRSNYRFWHPLRVRWAEVDMQKIVFNAHYLMYLDTAMADYWRALALPYEAAMQQLGGDIFVKKASVEYHASARYDDRLDVGLRCVRVGNSSILFEGAIFRGDTLVVTAELVYVYANPATQTPQPVPDVLRAIFGDFETGLSVTAVSVGDWDALGAHGGEPGTSWRAIGACGVDGPDRGSPRAGRSRRHAACANQRRRFLSPSRLCGAGASV